jgi:hypothetical protein
MMVDVNPKAGRRFYAVGRAVEVAIRVEFPGIPLAADDVKPGESAHRESASHRSPGVDPQRLPNHPQENIMMHSSTLSKKVDDLQVLRSAVAQGQPTALLQIESTPLGSKLFTDDTRPGGRVVFEVDAAGPNVVVRFDGNREPFVEAGSSFDLSPGASVEFTVKEGAAGNFPFQTETSSQILKGFRLAVEQNGNLDRSGFSFAGTASALSVHELCFLRVESLVSSLDLEVINRTNREQQILIVETASGNLIERNLGGETTTQIPISILPPTRGPERGALISLTTDARGTPENDYQSGGTEQVEIIIEPG